ncbi:hypothetical protein [Neolewinella agarilytica]|uniref:Lipoprotein n=1 Tax=Neolewinella agarilytica TaxID=478744 RepID=A0A1H9KQJ5_9BACT|nr:hypothetical protein [Neolewinella agarilytica]SER01197.1 hypothetical protein SAMN05444359_12167 [Neolewinella agarilytica]
MKAPHFLFVVLSLLLTSCAPDTPPGEEPEQNRTEQVDTLAAAPTSGLPPMAEKGDTSKIRRIVLNGYTCGDNCYLQYTPLVNGGHNQDALCSTPLCAEWEALGELPDELLGQEAIARFSVAPQYDGAGEVMQEDFPSIVELQLAEPQ